MSWQAWIYELPFAATAESILASLRPTPGRRRCWVRIRSRRLEWRLTRSGEQVPRGYTLAGPWIDRRTAVPKLAWALVEAVERAQDAADDEPGSRERRRIARELMRRRLLAVGAPLSQVNRLITVMQRKKA